MANLTTSINVNVDSKVKEQASIILKDLGLNMSTAINMFLNQVVKRNGIPFEVTNPKKNKDLDEALQELEYMQQHLDEYPKYKNRKELEEAFKKDGIL